MLILQANITRLWCNPRDHTHHQWTRESGECILSFPCLFPAINLLPFLLFAFFPCLCSLNPLSFPMGGGGEGAVYNGNREGEVLVQREKRKIEKRKRKKKRKQKRGRREVLVQEKIIKGKRKEQEKEKEEEKRKREVLVQREKNK